MAKKKAPEKAAEQKKKDKAKTGKMRLWMAMIVFGGVVFLPTSVLLVIGMLPSIVSFLVSSRTSSAKVSTVTAMNLAGCIPFVFKLWASGNDFEASFDIITVPRYITVMYTAAAFGYMIDWVVTGIVASFMYQRGIKRMEAIKKRQKQLKEQWGGHVEERSFHDVDAVLNE